jgi:CPA1 family monovalent cation:H+ antiporter
MVWGGLHASIPIALVLGLPAELPSGGPFPHREALRAMVFGVAGFSLVVQGLTMGTLLDRLDIVTRSEEAELYELLVGRARAVDSALEAAEELRAAGQLSGSTYREFTAEYEREKADLEAAIRELLETYPDLRREEIRAGERQLLRREKAAIMDAARTGVVADDVAEHLREEVDLKLERLRSGTSTVAADEEEFEEFWRSRAAKLGIEATEFEE